MMANTEQTLLPGCEIDDDVIPCIRLTEEELQERSERAELCILLQRIDDYVHMIGGGWEVYADFAYEMHKKERELYKKQYGSRRKMSKAQKMEEFTKKTGGNQPNGVENDLGNESSSESSSYWSWSIGNYERSK